MHGKRVLLSVLLILIFSLPSLRFRVVKLKASDSYPVHNLDTGLNYTAIQDAINANETLDGHAIFVEEGIYSEHVALDKSLSLVGENRNATIIDGSGTGNVVAVTASFASVSNFTIQNSGSSDSGVLLMDTEGSTAKNLTVSNCYYGIQCNAHSAESSHNTITNCDLAGYGYNYGVWIVESNDNLVSDNTISNLGFGVELYFDVTGNTLSNNNVTSCTFGITSYPCNNNTVTKNVVSNCSSGISLRGSNNIITENNVSYCEYGGIDIRLSNSTVVSGNVLTHSMGIWVAGGSGGSSDFNIISGNTLISNDHGFDVRYCRGNIFYHNNVINNTVQSYLADADNVWDHNGEGNYWSDYNGTDSNHDGIGDTPYTIDANNTDNHPLMGMFHSIDITFLPGSTVTLISNSTISHFHVVTVIESIETSKGIPTIFINFTDQTGYGFCRVSIPHALMNISNTPIIIDYGFTTVLNPNYTLYDNGTQRWIYFAYEQTTPPLNQTSHFPARIMIIPEFPSFLFPLLFMLATLLSIIVYKRKHTP